MDDKIPVGYPSALCGGAGIQMEKAYLRPIKQPCYDAEWLTPGKQYSHFRMFGRPCGQNFLDCMQSKDNAYTNMNEPNMLSTPLEFSVFGFNYALADDVSDEDRAKVKTGCFSFVFGGNRVYLTCPLIGMPTERRRKPIKEILTQIRVRQKNLEDKVIDVRSGIVKAGLKELEDSRKAEEIYDFTIGGKALRMRSGESFAVQYDWPEPIIVSKPVLLYSFIEGLMWTPL